jgi:limonene-1,2-epoxide hydrolase
LGEREESIALKFIGYFRDSWPEDLDAPLQLVSEDCYYQSIVPTTDRICGKAAIKAKWERIKAEYGDQRHDMRGVASSDTLVFTERTDWSHTNGKWVSIPLVAVFEIGPEGKIVAWREYLDGGNVARQIGMDVNDLEQSLRSGAA